MATVITSECINCGACEPECPNTAIYQGGVEWELNGVKHAPISNDIFYIVPEKCTECVGFYDHEACAAVCPVDCCVPDPNIPETEEVLIARAKQLHPDQTFGSDFPSRFRKQAGTAVAPEAAEAPVLPVVPPPAPVAAPAPVAKPSTPAVETKPAAPVAAPKPASAAEAKPAAAKPAAATKPATAPAAANAVAPEPKPAPAATPAAPGPAAAPVSEGAIAIPEIDEWEVPIECFRCRGTYTVPFKHFRSGVVFFCPFCQGSYVVNTSMHNALSRTLREFHRNWRKQFEDFQARRKQELEQFEERQRLQLEALNESIKKSCREFRPPGAPRKRAWIFG